MTNPILPKEEVDAVSKVLTNIEVLKEIHAEFNPNFDEDLTDLQKVHVLLYLHF